MSIDLEKARREELRWLVLRTLDAARPVGTSETIILSAVGQIVRDVTLVELRRELDYLEERHLISVSDRDTRVWFAKLARYGVDVVEYTVECHPGITRPKKYW